MRFAVLLSVCVLLATTSLCNGVEFSQVRDLPALKLGATDLDAILLKTHALIDAANGPEDLGRETVRVSIDGQDIEIPAETNNVGLSKEGLFFAHLVLLFPSTSEQNTARRGSRSSGSMVPQRFPRIISLIILRPVA